jgi:hypothetical protein
LADRNGSRAAAQLLRKESFGGPGPKTAAGRAKSEMNGKKRSRSQAAAHRE